ncbi:hypothetical protein ACSUZJ_07330 [Telluria sp. B2]
MSETEYLWNRRFDLRMRVIMNRMYYQERQRIFEFREGLVKVTSLLGASAAFAKVADPQVVQWCAAVITGTSAASLVFGFGTKARDSAKRSSEWALVERDIEARGERAFDEADLNKWAARCNELEAGEPAANSALLEKCYLRTCEVLGCKPSKEASWWDKYRLPIIIH